MATKRRTKCKHCQGTMYSDTRIGKVAIEDIWKCANCSDVVGRQYRSSAKRIRFDKLFKELE